MDKNQKQGQMLILNLTKKTKIGYATIADSFFSRFRGLMLKGSIDRGLILKLPKGRKRRSSGIHMFFMRIPLDVIFLDEEKKVVDQVQLKPWQVYTPKKPVRYILELKKGLITSSGTKIGDKIDFTCENA